MDYTNKTYPAKYMLEPELQRYFGIKQRTYKHWIQSGDVIPGRMKVRGSNYYVVDPSLFEPWYLENKLELATADNKFHNRQPIKQPKALIITTGGMKQNA